jgi:Kef-type K+ transport system membrane component KefB
MKAYSVGAATLVLGSVLLLTGADGHDAVVSNILLALVIVLPTAKLAGSAAEKLGQPAVLGELVAGIAIGNLNLIGFNGLEYLETDIGLELLAGLGVILLLFEVGLDSSLGDLLKVGLSSFAVATIGVILPFALGWGVSAFLLSDQSAYVHAFIGATLCATSVGITARVLQDLQKIRSREARIILGAAVIDDVLGLVVLAIISGLILGANTGAALSAPAILWLVAKIAIFLIGSLVLGVVFVPRFMRQIARLGSEGILFTFSLAFCFLLSYLASLIGLAAIVGAFAAGLILENVPFQELLHENERSPEDMLHPLSRFFVPIFFVQMGTKIDLASFSQPAVIGLALGLTIAAIVGKQLCGLGPLEKGLNRFAIGLGMIPRGEVGLIFAGVGLSLSIGGDPVFSREIFAAILIMVIVTTLITPPLLQWSFSRPSEATPTSAPI